MLNAIKRIIRKLHDSLLSKEVRAQIAYDLLSARYDEQPGNLLLALDEKLFSLMINDHSFKDKIVADVGCGTGRHWKKIYRQKPARLVGYDISSGMLDVLRTKFPEAETVHLRDNELPQLQGQYYDIILCNLALGYMKDPANSLLAWKRMLKKDASIFITEFHPDMLVNGGKRSFNCKGKNIAVKNYIHSIEKIRTIAKELQLHEENFIELKIDEEVKDFYKKQNALDVYERSRGMAIMYGLQLRKTDAAS